MGAPWAAATQNRMVRSPSRALFVNFIVVCLRRRGYSEALLQKLPISLAVKAADQDSLIQYVAIEGVVDLFAACV